MRPTQMILFSLNISQFFSSFFIILFFFLAQRFMPDINIARGGYGWHDISGINMHKVCPKMTI